MLHLPGLVNDLSFILIVAVAVTFVFKLINQPVVLGYILAGFFVGPKFELIPSVANGDTIKIWAEIGVIFLLFGLGLEFSFKKLKEVGGSASITAIVETVFMLAAGYVTGKLLGWTEMDSIFLGGILSISSTTIIIRAFDELGVKTHKYASVVFGVLIVEDLVAILLLVLLSTIAVSQQFEGAQLIFSSFKLVFFLCFWFIGGIFLIPSLLRKFKHHLTDELLLILSLGLCLGMVVFATHVGFSPALGAFVMGSVLSETTEGLRIEHLIRPMKDFFGAIFFVSVGMLIDPGILIEHWRSAVVISIVTIFGKMTSSMAGSLISGQNLKNSVQAGMSLAQIGEFSFIIATLGLTLNVTSNFLYPLAVAVSVITTFTTPYLIKYSGPTASYLERVMPTKVLDLIRNYSSSTQVMAVSSQIRSAFKDYVTKLSLLTVVLLAITILSKELALQSIYDYFQDKKIASSLAFISAFVLSTPFYWALVRGKMTEALVVFTTPRLSFLPFILHFLRYTIVIGIFWLQVAIFLPTVLSILIIVAVSLIGIFWYSKYVGNLYLWFEQIFLKNLNAKEHLKNSPNLLLPWEAHLATYEISPDADYIGQTLQSLAVREKYGVTVVLIERGKRRIKAPSRFERLYPYDKVNVIGTDEQLEKFRNFVDVTSNSADDFKVSDYGLKGCVLLGSSEFLGKTIRDSGIRELTEGLVVGLERGSDRIINPDTTIILEESDVLWIVGSKEKLKQLN